MSDSGVAPGSLGLVQAFGNTGSAAAGRDLLGTREEAASWLHEAGWLPPEAGLSGSEHAALLRLRDALRDTLAAHGGGASGDDAVARLTRALAEGRLVVTVGAGSTVQLASAARATYPSVVAAVAVAIADAAFAGSWLRLKACTAPRCGLAFYDAAARDASAAAVAGTGRCPAHPPA